MTRVDLDHTSFAVPDALALARRLRAELGAVPIVGETLPEFRYLLLYAGTAHRGARIELLEPAGPGFLSRFLETHGAGAHHITFSVPDLAATVHEVRALGLTVVGESYDHAPWREAFIPPDRVHGTVIQLAQSDLAYPSPAELLATTARTPADCPSSAGATDPDWWHPLWETEAGVPAPLGETFLRSTDLALSSRLFGAVLGADVAEQGDGARFSWPSGAVVVMPAAEAPGVTGMALVGGPAAGIKIGPAMLGAPPA